MVGRRDGEKEDRVEGEERSETYNFRSNGHKFEEDICTLVRDRHSMNNDAGVVIMFVFNWEVVT